jgi:hypothetical protein
LGVLEKTMKKNTESMEVLEKTRIVKRRPNPCFYSPNFLPKSYKHEGKRSNICVDLQNTRGGKSKLFNSCRKLGRG